jgi:hypothetical protein
LTFTNKIGELAEKDGNHQDILTEWGKVTVMCWTHKIKGLHQNDFIMAAKTDGLYNSSKAHYMIRNETRSGFLVLFLWCTDNHIYFFGKWPPQ